MNLRFEIKRFNELSAAELYDILLLRAEVFVVEQNCVYQDIDGKDGKALHLIGTADGKIVAYSRLFAPGDYYGNASIGRVVISPAYRDRKWGHDLIKASLAAIANKYNTSATTIMAQLYLKKYYEGHGFVQDGEPFLEDGIPHIMMHRN